MSRKAHSIPTSLGLDGTALNPLLEIITDNISKGDANQELRTCSANPDSFRDVHYAYSGPLPFSLEQDRLRYFNNRQTRLATISDLDNCNFPESLPKRSKTFRHPKNLDEQNLVRNHSTPDDFLTVRFPPPYSGTIFSTFASKMRTVLRTPSSPGSALALDHNTMGAIGHNRPGSREGVQKPSLHYEGSRWRCDENGWWVERTRARAKQIPGSYHWSPRSSVVEGAEDGSEQNQKSPIKDTLPPSPPPHADKKSSAAFESDRFAIITPTAQTVHRYEIPVSRRPPTPPESPPPAAVTHRHRRVALTALSDSAPTSNHATRAPIQHPVPRRKPCVVPPIAKSKPSKQPSYTAYSPATSRSCSPPTKSTVQTKAVQTLTTDCADHTPAPAPDSSPLWLRISPSQLLRILAYLYITVCVWYALNELKEAVTFAAWPLRICWRVAKIVIRSIDAVKKAGNE